jgi:hypothetical protein
MQSLRCSAKQNLLAVPVKPRRLTPRECVSAHSSGDTHDEDDALAAFRLAKSISLSRSNLGAFSSMPIDKEKFDFANIDAATRFMTKIAPSFQVVHNLAFFSNEDALAVIFFVVSAHGKDE